MLGAASPAVASAAAAAAAPSAAELRARPTPSAAGRDARAAQSVGDAPVCLKSGLHAVGVHASGQHEVAMQGRDGRVNGPPQPGRQRPDARQKAAERAAEMAAIPQ